MERQNRHIYLVLIIALFGILPLSAQITPGFSKEEAVSMIKICNSFTYMDLYGNDNAIIPSQYSKIYTSPSYGMDNKFQVYKGSKTAVINFRGTTVQPLSWMANLYASMIPAKGEIVIDGAPFPYQMGKNRGSHIHSGYTLAIYYLKNDLLFQIHKLNQAGIYDIYLTGHSQGAALAQLIRAYFDGLPKDELNPKNNFKVYAFASPMIGNKSFVNEYNQRFCAPKMSFLMNNPDDIVPKLPMSANDSTFWKENITQYLMESEKFSKTNFFVEGMMMLFRDQLIEMAKKMSKNIEKNMFLQLGDIQMPQQFEDFDYRQTGNEYKILPTVYPLELRDSTILKNDSLMKIYQRDEKGNFTDKSLYKNRGMWLQHKPYNYYSAMLKEYFPAEYRKLDQKYFVDPRE